MINPHLANRVLDSSLYLRDESSPLVQKPIGAVLLETAERFGSKTALIDGHADADVRTSWSYKELADEAKKVASALLEHFEPGQRVAIWGSNSPQWALIEFGASLAGLVLVTVNPAYLLHELKHVLGQSQAQGIIVQDNYRGRNLYEVVEEARPDLPDLEVIIPLSSWKEFISSGQAKPLPEVNASDMAQIQYTSGTTGFPKGACLPHLGLTNNGRFYAQTIGANEDDVWVNPMPMFHTAGCGLATLGALQTGGKHVMPSGFDAGLMLDLFEQEGGTIMLCVPTMLIRMLEEQERNPRNLNTWRLVTLGGAPVPAELVHRAERIAGVDVAIGFGQTEASPYLTHTVVKDSHPEWLETVGKPLPQTDVKIINPKTGEVAPIGESGEICGRGYGVMMGYYSNPKATEETIDRDGWLHTGDIGSMDEHGYCRVHGRLRDMIIRGGENIYPREVEDVLFTHPAVASVAVIGMPDPEWGESVEACVIFREGENATSQELEGFCREHLASYKVPRNWHFLDSFPQTASGKIQKFALRDQLANVS